MASKPPTAPQIPLQAVQSLIPRLSTTINDIDALRAQLAAGHADGSMPSWDTLLQRYSLLLGRIHSISQYVSQPPPPARPAAGPGAPAVAAAAAAASARPPAAGPSAPAPTPPPLLASYLVHPLHPLPADATPLAADLMFQVINTQLLPSVTSSAGYTSAPAGAGASGSGSGAGAGTATEGTLSARITEHAPELLARMDDVALGAYTRALRTRTAREGQRAQALLREIVRREDEVDWAMRIRDDDDDEGEGEGEGGDGAEVASKREDGDGDGDGDDDLFGEDDEGDAVMAAPVAAKAANPREGWNLADYLRYMEKGVGPGPGGET
ncbi:hypothetical protein Q5752_004824 [Cryptotrichosporon argae]